MYLITYLYDVDRWLWTTEPDSLGRPFTFGLKVVYEHLKSDRWPLDGLSNIVKKLYSIFDSRSPAHKKLRADFGHRHHFRLWLRVHAPKRFEIQRSRVCRFRVRRHDFDPHRKKDMMIVTERRGVWKLKPIVNIIAISFETGMKEY